jgi:cysteinyl-tRNA synthetase
MLQLGSEKMSKSLGNIVTIKEFLAQNDPDVMRMIVLNGSYRAPLIFNEETIASAAKGLERLRSALRPASASARGLVPETVSALSHQCEATQQAFTASMDEDFNTSGALAALYELVRLINTARDHEATDSELDAARKTLISLTGVLGLRLAEKKAPTGEVDEAWIQSMIDQRKEARLRKDWAASDSIRNELLEKDILLEDTKDGTLWRRK